MITAFAIPASPAARCCFAPKSHAKWPPQMQRAALEAAR
ncbi:TPA: hypothetical protein RQN55_001911 [Aeromonas dhakensis]|nr:hypothetical protein [Aeromonas dhakensis]